MLLRFDRICECMSLIESEGVEVIPEEKRTRGFWQVFAIWAGFSIVITNFLLGSLTVGAGLVPGVVAVTLSILLVGGIVYYGTKIAATEGTAGTTAMRAPFGIQGRIIPALGIAFAGMGWFGVQTGIVAQSAELILAEMGFDVPFVVLAFVFGLLMAGVAIFGYRWIEWLNRLAVPIMTVLLALVVYQIWTEFTIELGAGGGEMSFWVALNVFPAAVAAFLMVAMDYGRYGDDEAPGKPSLGASLAWILFAIALAIIGIVAAMVAGEWNPVLIMVELGLGSVGLLLLILGSWTTNVTNVYVSGMGLSQLFGSRRVYMTTLSGVVGTGFAMAGIFTFSGIEAFLEGLTITLVPTTGILFVHYYLIEGGIDTDALFDTGGKYWYLRGWNPAAVVAWVIGAAYAIFSPDWTVPALSALVLAGAIYYVLYSPIEDWIGTRRPRPAAAD